MYVCTQVPMHIHMCVRERGREKKEKKKERIGKPLQAGFLILKTFQLMTHFCHINLSMKECV